MLFRAVIPYKTPSCIIVAEIFENNSLLLCAVKRGGYLWQNEDPATVFKTITLHRVTPPTEAPKVIDRPGDGRPRIGMYHSNYLSRGGGGDNLSAYFVKLVKRAFTVFL